MRLEMPARRMKIGRPISPNNQKRNVTSGVTAPTFTKFLYDLASSSSLLMRFYADGNISIISGTSIKAEILVKNGRVPSEIIGRICQFLPIFSHKYKNEQTELQSY